MNNYLEMQNDLKAAQWVHDNKSDDEKKIEDDIEEWERIECLKN